MTRILAGVAIIAALMVAPGEVSAQATPSYAFVTNGVADFWNHAEAGAKQAGKDLNVDVSVIMP
ncbi:MAG TPA: hypothetical protein VHU84_09335, partial [Lacipirellulaceae bacterium]|nr:hypothetical protein [Lacipirellulaceae bacterium]